MNRKITYQKNSFVVDREIIFCLENHFKDGKNLTITIDNTIKKDNFKMTAFISLNFLELNKLINDLIDLKNQIKLKEVSNG